MVLGVEARVWAELQARDQEIYAWEQMTILWYVRHRWLEELPVDAMIAARWLPAVAEDPRNQSPMSARIIQLLYWFGVSSPEAWREIYVEPQASFHRDPWFEADPGVLAAWMRAGEKQAELMKTAPYDRKKFLTALEQIRALTIQPPAIYQDRMIELAASAAELGIAPGIVVGYLQKLGLLPENWCNHLKHYLEWAPAGTEADPQVY